MNTRIFNNSITKRIISFILLTALLLTMSITNVSAENVNPSYETDLNKMEDKLPIKRDALNSMKVFSVEKNLAISEKEMINIYANYSDSGDVIVTLSVDNSLIQEYTEIVIDVTLPDNKDFVYKGITSPGNETFIIENISIDTEYHVLAEMVKGDDITSYIGQFTIYEKDDELSSNFKFTEERFKSAEYVKNKVQTLEFASEIMNNDAVLTDDSISIPNTTYEIDDQGESVEEFNSQNKNDIIIDDFNNLKKQIIQERMEIASEIISMAAVAGTGYEVEPNNSISNATVVNDDDTTFGKISSSTDVDYYMVKFSSNGIANFWLGDIPAGKDYDFYLYNSAGTQLASSTGTSNQEQIYDYPVTAGVSYYMMVKGYNGANDTVNYYRVRAKNYPAAATPDYYEYNDTTSYASPIANTATISSANIHSPNDIDYYRFTISSTSNVNLALSNIPSGCDYDLQLYDSANVLRGSSTVGGNSSESIYITLLPAGTYYIKVYSYIGYSNNYYYLTVSSIVTSSADIYEPNNTTSMATSIGNNTTITSANLHLTSDIDYFRFTITSTSNVAISLSNIPYGCDYDLQVYDSSNILKSSSAMGGNNNENISAMLDSGTYYIKVYPYTGSSDSYYRLTVSSSVPMEYGNFSRYVSSPTIPSNITTPLSIINTEYDVWPAGSISRYYGLPYSYRIDSLLNIHQLTLITVVGGTLVGSPNAASHLAHFLNNTGATKSVPFKTVNTNDSGASSARTSDINEAMIAAEQLAQSGQNIVFSSVNHREHDPSTSDWIRAVGRYSTKLSCSVTKNGSQYTATFTYYFYDVYDWNRNITDMGMIPVSPKDMWELQYGGLAKGYYSSGTNTLSITWTQGQRIGTGAIINSDN